MGHSHRDRYIVESLLCDLALLDFGFTYWNYGRLLPPTPRYDSSVADDAYIIAYRRVPGPDRPRIHYFSTRDSAQHRCQKRSPEIHLQSRDHTPGGRKYCGLGMLRSPTKVALGIFKSATGAQDKPTRDGTLGQDLVSPG